MNCDFIEQAIGPEPVAILLIEQEEGSLDAVRLALPGVRVLVLPMAGLNLAPDLVSREKIRVVFCEQAGLEASLEPARQRLLRVHPGLAVIQVVAANDTSAVLDAFHLGASDVLVQPLTPGNVCRAFARVQAREWEQGDARRLEKATRALLDELVLLPPRELDGDTAALDVLLGRLTHLIREALRVEIVSLMLTDDGGELRVRATTGLPAEIRQQCLPLDANGIAAQVFSSGQPILLNDLETDGRFTPQAFAERYTTQSLLSVPIACHGTMLGVLNVNNKQNGETFEAADLDLLLGIAHQAALAIENVRLMARMARQGAELKQAQAELLTFHRGRARFVNRLSHELKTPLTSVIGFADLVLEMFERLSAEKLREYLESLHGEALQLDALLSGLLRLFSIDSGTETWCWQALDLTHLANEACQRFSVLMAEQELDFELVVADEVPCVWGAEDKLVFLLDALFDSLLRFRQFRGALRLELGSSSRGRQEGAVMRLSCLKDDFPETEIRSFLLQEPDAEPQTGHAGVVGISLAICRGILHKMQGQICLQQDDADKISLVFYLPAKPLAEGKENCNE